MQKRQRHIMKGYLFFTVLLFFNATAIAQKPSITDTSFKAWQEVRFGKISNDGRFILYETKNLPVGGNSLIITSADKSWCRKYTTVHDAEFGDDSKDVFGMSGVDTLVRLKLNTDEVFYIPNCKLYKLYSNGKKQWLIYQLKDNSLIVEDLNTNQKSKLTNVESYFLNPGGNAIITKSKSIDDTSEIMSWFSITSGQSKVIYEGKTSSQLIFNKGGDKLCFTTKEQEDKKIWYYRNKLDGAKLLSSSLTSSIPVGYQINTDEIWRFSTNGENLFFTVSVLKKINKISMSGAPDIWSYEDAYPFPYYKNKDISAFHHDENLCVMNIEKPIIRQLLHGTQIVKDWNQTNDDVLIVQSSFGHMQEAYWNKSAQLSMHLLFTQTGKLVPILNNYPSWLTAALSPDNKFLVFVDERERKYYCYNVLNGQRTSLSDGITESLYQYDPVRRNDSSDVIGGIAGWIKNDQVIIQGTYNLYSIDLKSHFARNLTNGEGERNKIIFSLQNSNAHYIVNDKDILTLSGLDLITKAHNIYNLDLPNQKMSLLFSTIQCIGQTGHVSYAFYGADCLIKAKDTRAYLVLLGDATSSLNYFSTSDFNNFDRISNYYPEKKYNWMTSELVKYKDDEGGNCEGILYKPENFDSNKKYPLIFQYYLDQSNYFNEYLLPEPNLDGINIPLLLSNGYLVFKPNIYHVSGHPGQSVLTSINAAVDHLKTFTWIDTARMGITGHSLGGWETNFIVTHSNRFKAAIAGAGPSNLINTYNDIWAGGLSTQGYVKQVMNMRENLEDNPQSYVYNSPILHTKNITTPLLLLHNEMDASASFKNTSQFFIQLRSEQKSVWLLQYKGEDHGLTEEQNQLDFQNRVLEFFGHYLKGQPIPDWMNRPFNADTK